MLEGHYLPGLGMCFLCEFVSLIGVLQCSLRMPLFRDRVPFFVVFSGSAMGVGGQIVLLSGFSVSFMHGVSLPSRIVALSFLCTKRTNRPVRETLWKGGEHPPQRSANDHTWSPDRLSLPALGFGPQAHEFNPSRDIRSYPCSEGEHENIQTVRDLSRCGAGCGPGRVLDEVKQITRCFGQDSNGARSGWLEGSLRHSGSREGRGDFGRPRGSRRR